MVVSRRLAANLARAGARCCSALRPDRVAFSSPPCPSGADVWLDGTYVGRTPAGRRCAGGRRAHSRRSPRTGWTPEAARVSVVAAADDAQLGSARAGRRAPSCARCPARSRFTGWPPARRSIDGAPVDAAEGRDDRRLAPEPTTLRRPHAARQAHANGDRVSADAHRRGAPGRREPRRGRPSSRRPTTICPRPRSRSTATRVVLQYGGHEVVGRLGTVTYRVDGRSVDYDAAPTLIGRVSTSRSTCLPARSEPRR